MRKFNRHSKKTFVLSDSLSMFLFTLKIIKIFSIYRICRQRLSVKMKKEEILLLLTSCWLLIFSGVGCEDETTVNVDEQDLTTGKQKENVFISSFSSEAERRARGRT